jgi:hypothetical protein
MADSNLLSIIRRGSDAWNSWRNEQLHVNAGHLRADFHGADLSEINLSGANLSVADLRDADLRRAILHQANLSWADLSGANLDGADLTGARMRGVDMKKTSLIGAILKNTNLGRADLSEADLSDADMQSAILDGVSFVGTNLERANLTGCRTHGTSVWRVNLKGAVQSGLIISTEGEPEIKVDNLEVAQFVYLLLNNERIRSVIDTINSKAVLILGRFSPERKAVLDALRDELRKRDLLPIIFDFDKPTNRDFTETVITLAGMSKFIIADLTQPKSSPLESHATITSYMIPFIPIIQEGEWPFAMFVDLQRKYHWVLKTLQYKDKEDLLQWVDKIIERADEKYREILLEKAHAVQKPLSGADW